MTRQHHRGWRKNRKRKYRIFPGYIRLPLEDLPTLLSDRFPVAFPRRNGGHVWRFAYPAKATPRSLRRLEQFRVDWDFALDNLRAEGLVAAMNDAGYVTVRYESVLTRELIEQQRKHLRDLLFFSGARDLAEYFKMEYGNSLVLPFPRSPPRLRIERIVPRAIGDDE